MELEKYDGKHVRVTDIFGESHTGPARFGGTEDGIFIGDVLLNNSQIASIEEIEVHGTVALQTDRLTLRRYRPEDADSLYWYLGTDPAMDRYSGWNPYATPEMARETVAAFIAGYQDARTYSWVLDADNVLVGTIGANDYQDDRIEVGFSVIKGWQGRGFATAALKKVLEYLTGNEGIPCVTAWYASENAGSRKVLERAGMGLVRTEKNALKVGDREYDKLTYEYRS